MEHYRNLSGSSGVKAYEIGPDFIDVEFGDMIYRYSYACTGRTHVENMKERARAGRGLSTYISVTVKGAYQSKRVA